MRLERARSAPITVSVVLGRCTPTAGESHLPPVARDCSFVAVQSTWLSGEAASAAIDLALTAVAIFAGSLCDHAATMHVGRRHSKDGLG